MPGLAGRRRTPTALHLVRGNPGKRELPKKEPKPKRGKPAKPPHITSDKIASAEWDRIAALTSQRGANVLTVSCGPILEATALAYSILRAAQLELTKGLTYEVRTKAGGKMIRAKPQVFIAADAWRRYVAGLSHFGLSPATAGKVQTIDDDGREKNPEAPYGL